MKPWSWEVILKSLKDQKRSGRGQSARPGEIWSLASFVTDEDLADMKAGKMISDQTVINVITAVLKTEPYNSAFGLFFDGFPRNLEQVKIFNREDLVA